MKKFLIITLVFFLIAGVAVKIYYFTGSSSGERILKTALWLDKNFKTNLVRISANPFIDGTKIAVTTEVEVYLWGCSAPTYSKTIKKVSKCELASFCPSCEGIEIPLIHNSPQPKIGFEPERGRGSTDSPFILLNESTDLDDDIVLCQWQVMNTSYCFNDACYNECFETCDDITLLGLNSGEYRAALSVTDTTSCTNTAIRDFIIE